MSLFGSMVLCLVVYLRWQLGDASARELVSSIVHGVEPPLAANDCCPAAPVGSPQAPACAAGIAPREREPEPEWMRAPGVYVDTADSAGRANRDATSRGRWLAERIIRGRNPGELPRRGQKGALDVIVVGANLLGISATVRLMQAGLRVLLVDRQSWAPLDAATHRLIASRPGVDRRLRLPLVTGHHVTLVARRADGMLELQAERAGWYTANVLFASAEAAAPVSERPSGSLLPIVPCVPAASRAA